MDRRRSKRRITLGADKAYDVTGFVTELRDHKVTPHIAIDGHLTKIGKRRKTAIDRRTLRHAGYEVSQRCRARVDAAFTLALVAYNLIRLPKLLAAPT